MNVIRSPFSEAEMTVNSDEMFSSLQNLISNSVSIIDERNFKVLNETLRALKPDIVTAGPIPVEHIAARFLGAEIMQFSAYFVDVIGSFYAQPT